MAAKRERIKKQGWAKHSRNFDGGKRYISKAIRRKAKENCRDES